eukprot:1999299-Pyramimonas_sp.AAC.1
MIFHLELTECKVSRSAPLSLPMGPGFPKPPRARSAFMEGVTLGAAEEVLMTPPGFPRNRLGIVQ